MLLALLAAPAYVAWQVRAWLPCGRLSALAPALWPGQQKCCCTLGRWLSLAAALRKPARLLPSCPQNVGRPLNWIDALAALLCAGFIAVEAVADQQQWNFQARPQQRRHHAVAAVPWLLQLPPKPPCCRRTQGSPPPLRPASALLSPPPLLPHRAQSEKHARLGAGQRLTGEYAPGFITSGLFRYSRHPNFWAEQARPAGGAQCMARVGRPAAARRWCRRCEPCAHRPAGHSPAGLLLPSMPTPPRPFCGPTPLAPLQCFWFSVYLFGVAASGATLTPGCLAPCCLTPCCPAACLGCRAARPPAPCCAAAVEAGRGRGLPNPAAPTAPPAALARPLPPHRPLAELDAGGARVPCAAVPGQHRPD